MSRNTMGFVALAAMLALTACGNSDGNQSAAGTQPAPAAQAPAASAPSPAKDQGTAAEPVKAFKEMLAELGKSANGGKVDYTKVEAAYNGSFKKLALARDPELTEQQLASAIQAGKEGTLPSDLVNQIVDKLGQKVMLLAVRNEFKEFEANFADKAKAKAKAKANLDNSKVYYDYRQARYGIQDAAGASD